MAEKGRSLLIKRGDGATSETFTTIAGLIESSISINGGIVDVTTKDSSGWRKLLAGAGTTSVAISGSGRFEDGDGTFELLETACMNKTLNNYEIIVTDSGDKFAGSFQVASVERSGGYEDEIKYSLTLESSGTISFTAA